MDFAKFWTSDRGDDEHYAHVHIPYYFWDWININDYAMPVRCLANLENPCDLGLLTFINVSLEVGGASISPRTASSDMIWINTVGIFLLLANTHGFQLRFSSFQVK